MPPAQAPLPPGRRKYVQEKMTKRVGIPILVNDGGIKAEGAKEKAEVLGTYFGNVFTVEPEGEVDSVPIRHVPTLEIIDFSNNKIGKVLDNMKKSKSPGPDGIHPRIIKEGGANLALPLSMLFKK